MSLLKARECEVLLYVYRMLDKMVHPQTLDRWQSVTKHYTGELVSIDELRAALQILRSLGYVTEGQRGKWVSVPEYARSN